MFLAMSVKVALNAIDGLHTIVPEAWPAFLK